jgi:glycosyltransferase involved in cell wall biosynthesis
MKIGFIGNTNNSPFMVAKALRRLGCDVRLVVNRPETLHRPESKDPVLAERYPEWIGDFAALTSSYVLTESPLIPEVMRFLGDDLDAVVLNDVGLALNDGRFNCPVLALLTGSDLLYHASFSSLAERTSGWPLEFRDSPSGAHYIERITLAIEAQREGIRRADAVNFMPAGVIPEGDGLLEELGIGTSDPRRFFLQIADAEDVEHRPLTARRRMRIFNGARVIWHRPLPPGLSDLDHKGTDVLVRGFAEYLDRGGEGHLRLVEKGYDVERTRQLVRELGLAEHVVWLGELSHAGFYEELANSDVVVDQLGTSLPGMVSVDAMTMGRVVLANFRLEHMGPYYPQPRPFLHATTQDEVCESLMVMYLDPVGRARLAKEAAIYMQRHYAPEVNARKLLSRLGLHSPSGIV